MTAEFADLMLGYYGECIGERNPELIKQAEAQTKKQQITVRPADLLEPEWEQLTDEAKTLEGFDGTDEDVLTNALFPGVAPGFFKTRHEGPKNVGVDPAKQVKRDNEPVLEPITYQVTVGGRTQTVRVEPAE